MNDINQRIREVDRITIRAERKRGPDKHTGEAYLDPRFYTGQAFVEALQHAVFAATEPARRKLASMPEDELIDRGFGVFAKLHAAANPSRTLDGDEMRDMGQCIYTYTGRGWEWIQRNVRNYTACDPHSYLRYEPLVKLKTGRRLAILNRVVCVNAEDWDRPPLYIPTSYGVYLYMQQRGDDERGEAHPFYPPEWMERLEAMLHPHGMQGNAREAFNKARAHCKLEPI